MGHELPMMDNYPAFPVTTMVHFGSAAMIDAVGCWLVEEGLVCRLALLVITAP